MASLVCLHGAESHSGWFSAISRQAMKTGIWRHVVAIDRPGWRGDVVNPRAAHAWIEANLSEVESRLSTGPGEDSSGAGIIDIVATSWGALAALHWWLAIDSPQYRKIRSLHLVAPGVVLSRSFQWRIWRRMAADTLVGKGLVGGRLSLALELRDFIHKPEKYPLAADFLAHDPIANHEASLAFFKTTIQMRRRVQSGLSKDVFQKHPIVRPYLVMHLPLADEVIDLSRTRVFSSRRGIRCHHYDAAGHALLLMQPERILQNILSGFQSTFSDKNRASGNDFSVEISEYKSGFRFPVRHSHGSRTGNHAFVIKITAPGQDGLTISGLGEVLPRQYLTGESPESVKSRLRSVVESFAVPVMRTAFLHIDQGKSPTDLADVAGALIQAWRQASRAHCLALWSGVDLALVDWLSKALKVSPTDLMRRVSDAVGENKEIDDFRVTEFSSDPSVHPHRPPLAHRATIPMVSVPVACIFTILLRLLGYRLFKVKVGDPQSLGRVVAVYRVAKMTLFGRQPDLTLDANQGYSFESAERLIAELRTRYPQITANIIAFEDPVHAGSSDRLSQFQPRAGIPIMVDEWLSGEGDAGIFAASKDIRFWNLRVGKCGGLTGTVIMGRLGYRAGVKLVLGALVGEDALMIRAGDVVARILPLAWREDSFSRLLLQKSVFASNRVRKRAIIRGADGFGLDAAEIKAEHSFAVHRFHAGTVSKSTPDDFAF